MSVTLRDIARESGFSKTAVWMAMNGKPGLPEATKEKIQNTAAEMGYRPNAAYREMLRQVRAGESVSYRSTLGLLHAFDVPDPEKYIPYHASIIDGLERRANEHGYYVDRFWVNEPNLSGDRLSNIMLSRGIQGVAILPMPSHRSIALQWDKFAAVAVGYTLIDATVNRVNVNNQQAMALCMCKLFELGYKKMGLVLRTDYENSRRYELTAPYMWMQSFKKPKDVTPYFIADPKNRTAFLKWFRKYQFDSLVTAHSCIVKWLRDEGYTIPGDVGVVFPTPVEDYQDFSHINQEPTRIGSAVVDMLIAQLNRGEFGVPRNLKSLHIDVTYQDGVSTRKVGKPQDSGLLREVVRMPQSEW